MGKVLSSIKHPFRNFNLESRAHKVISQPTPKVAPKHLKDELDLKRIKEEHPDLFKEGLKKHKDLNKHLRDVFVVSHDPPPIKENPDRPKPQDRSQPEAFLFGHKEPDILPIGKTTLRIALEFISKHQSDPVKYTAGKIAEEQNLVEDTVKNILKYCRVFEVYIPDQDTKTKASFAGPSVPKSIVIKDIRKQLPPPPVFKKEKDDT